MTVTTGSSVANETHQQKEEHFVLSVQEHRQTLDSAINWVVESVKLVKTRLVKELCKLDATVEFHFVLGPRSQIVFYIFHCGHDLLGPCYQSKAWSKVSRNGLAEEWPSAAQGT